MQGIKVELLPTFLFKVPILALFDLQPWPTIPALSRLKSTPIPNVKGQMPKVKGQG